MNKLFFLLAACLLQGMVQVQAGVEPVLRNSMTGNSIRVDSFKVIEDIQYTTSNLSAYNLYRVENYVSAEINQDQIASCYLDTFSFGVNVEILGWDEFGSQTVDTGYFEIYYDQRLGKQYRGIQTKKMSGFYKMEFRVIYVSDTNLTDYIRISGEVAIERYQDLDTGTLAAITASSFINSYADIQVTWSSVTGAEEYDLEYTFVDNYDGDGGTLSVSDLACDFEHNASRVTVKGNSYTFSNVFEQGHVVFRVRPASYIGANFTYRVVGKWSNHGYDPELDNYNSYERIATTQLESTLNWQYVNTFSEWGKRKELISFMDGSFRDRQSVTRISSDTTVIIGEMIYDYQGRPALQVLPVPHDNVRVKYYPDFNMDSISGDNYEAVHFDTGLCTTIPHPMKTTSGANNYYSSTNEFLSLSNHWLQDHNPYIPEADGYAFVRTIYTDDNSGRVAVQSGVGKTHSIGEGHETRYYYGTPYQEELDRLFGNNVGFAKHYQKQMVVDPNGQVSVSYTDLSGKVIATALAGENPDNVSQLSNNTGPFELEVQLVPYLPAYQPDAYTTELSKKIVVAVPGQYKLDYILELTGFSDECMTECYECVYDLTLSVVDECGAELLDGDDGTGGIQPFTRTLKRVDSSHFSISCLSSDITYISSSDALLGDTITVTLGVGTYYVTKTLTVNEEAANYYADRHLTDTACVLEEQDFIDYYAGISDDFGCNVSCEECSDLLSDSLAYINTRTHQLEDNGYTIENPGTGYANDFLTQMLAEEYHRRKLICQEICTGSISPCEYMRIAMEVDVAPGGQYEEFDGDITQHPEYCKYQFCQSNEQAYYFENMLDTIVDGNNAIQWGLLDPLLTQGGKYPTGIYDTFFYDNGTYKTILLNELAAIISVQDYYMGDHDLNIWQTSIWVTNYVLGQDTMPFYSPYAEAIATNNAFDFDGGRCYMKDPMLWEVFRGLYKVARRNALEQIMNSSTCSTLSIPTGKQVRFPGNSDITDELGSNETEISTGVYGGCHYVCDSMSNIWIELLGDCVKDHPNREAIRQALATSCRNNCGPGNPIGSSDGFKAVLETYGVYEAGKCDPRIISTPPLSTSYDPWSLDSNDYHCACSDEEEPCLFMDTDPNYRNAIRILYYQSQEIYCDTLCLECRDIQTALIPFFEELGDTLVVLDSTANWPIIMTSYLNNRLQVNHDYETYLEFMASCVGLSNVSDDSVVQVFQDLPTPVEYVSTQYYIDSIRYEIETSSIDQYPGEDYFRPNPGIAYAFHDSGRPDRMDWNWGTQPGYSGFQPTSMSCSGTVLLDPCICGALMDKIKDNPDLADPSDPGWSGVWTCGGVDLGEVIQACASAWMNKEGKNPLDMDSLTWDKQDSINLWEIARADHLYLPTACRTVLQCDDCNSLDPPPGPPIYIPSGGGGGTWYIHTTSPPEVTYTPYLPCDSILSRLDSFISANRALMSLKPIPDDVIELAANYIDSIYAGEPYYRQKTQYDPDDDLEYRKSRLLAEVQRCTAPPFDIDPCYYAHPSADTVRAYFACDSLCVRENDLPPLVREWLRQETWLIKTPSPLAFLSPGRSNLLVTNGHGLYDKGVDAYYNTELYLGGSPDALLHTYKRGMGFRGPGPKKFTISDGTDSVQLTLSFYAPDEKLSLINRIRGIVSIKPYKILPCDNTMSFLLEVLVEDKDKNVYQLPMFGSTDEYELMDFCGVKPKLCGRQKTANFHLEPASPCLVDVDLIHEAFAKRMYQKYADSVRRNFIHHYKTQCIQQAIPTESLTMRFFQNEYHYTLYYYDLAGNLIQTVPPEGVNFASPGEVTQSDFFRKGLYGSPHYAEHDLTTTYQYNALNELKWQNTPDGGVSDFWYDRLGRLVISRNAKQKAYANPTYSYTRYDVLGRISEVGEVYKAGAGDTMSFTLAFGSSLNTWISTGTRSQITNTYYDEAAFAISYNGFSQNYLRNRVSSTTYMAAGGAASYQSAVHYDYDVHGNVKAMVREVPGLDSIFEDFKVIRYEYELISGNVLQVLYQQDSLDRFFHKYTYDADNRVTAVYTSRDQVHWDRDARYTYYLHGPMARTELGELRVQGMDYAYTLHGWLKGVNSERLKTSHDIGKDGNTGSVNQWVCRDVFGFGLGYYTGDYSDIGGVAQGTHFIIDQSGSTMRPDAQSLYNGNISSMVTAIGKLMSGSLPFGRSFRYDQLNRIISSDAYANADTVDNEWSSSGAALSQYATDYTYDANGNILTLQRNGKAGLTSMDNLTYHYYAGTNRLEYVDDAVSSGNYGIDIDDQWTGNYTYDAIGNLVSDSSEQIEEITWTVYGKIRSISRVSGSSKPDLEFEYSPDGYRSAKHVTDPTTGFTTSTWYVRDASGNIMATYEKSEYTGLDTNLFTFEELNSLVLADWGAHVFSRFVTEELYLQNELTSGQYDDMRTYLTTYNLEETLLKMNDPWSVLQGNPTLRNDVLSSYSISDFTDAMIGYYGSEQDFVVNAMLPNCGQFFISYLLQNYNNSSFLEYMLSQFSTEANVLWGTYGWGGMYPGDAAAAAHFTSASVPQFQDDFALILMSNGHGSDFISQFVSYYGGGTLLSDIQSYAGTKGCAYGTLGDQTFSILDLYDRNLLWDYMIMNSSTNSLVNQLSFYDPAAFVQSYLELNSGSVDDLMQNSTNGGYHVTDYLNAILNYPSFGVSYYENIVNQLMSLGYVGGGWNYTAQEHHLYGSSRVGVHRTDLLLRTRFAAGDISVTSEDMEYTSLYRGKRHYELSNHLGNVQVIVSDKRISVCDEYLAVDYFEAEVLAAMDYYPFGMMMPDRQWYANSDSSAYRFGFNGKEIDREHGGVGNVYDYGFRIYNPALGKFLSVDPLTSTYPFFTPYQFASNSPIACNDIDGLEAVPANEIWDIEQVPVHSITLNDMSNYYTANIDGTPYEIYRINEGANKGNYYARAYLGTDENGNRMYEWRYIIGADRINEYTGENAKQESIDVGGPVYNAYSWGIFLGSFKYVKYECPDMRDFDYEQYYKDVWTNPYIVTANAHFTISSLPKGPRQMPESVGVGVSGTRISQTHVANILRVTGNEEVITLYRAVSGTEGSTGLYLTTSLEYAKQYGQNVIKIEVSKAGFMYLVNEGLIDIKTGMMVGGTEYFPEYLISNQNLVKEVLKHQVQ